MRIHIATDHAGLDFSVQLQQHLRDCLLYTSDAADE